MNFRTTLVLLGVALVGIGVFVGIRIYESKQTEPPKTSEERKLVDIPVADITKVDIRSDDKHIVLQKIGSDWKLLEPVAAAAKTFEADDLARALTELTSHERVDASKKTSGGLDHPSFVVAVSSAAKTVKLSFGDNAKVGDTALYVQVNDNAQPDIIGNSIYAKLDAPASTYREMKLVSVSSADVKQLSISEKGKTVKLEKVGDDWKITEPLMLPAERSTVTDVLSSLTGLNATEFLDTPSALMKKSLTHPRLKVWYSTKASSTQPSQGETLALGDEDASKKGRFAALDGKEFAIVSADSIKSFEKTPLDFRSKELLKIDPDLVSSLTVAINHPATTQPAAKPAELREFTIERHKAPAPVFGPVAPPIAPATRPTTGPATEPVTAPALATTAPATQPTGKYMFITGGEGVAEEGQVDDLLGTLHPLHVEKYIEPATLKGATYALTIHAIPAKAGESAADYVITLTDIGTRVVGKYKDVDFEVNRSLLDKLNGDFKTKKAPPPPPPSMPPNHPPFGGGESPFNR